jgi:FKBP-type peptidyl-prolyl cis-trans isomerase (trigger factor)
MLVKLESKKQRNRFLTIIMTGKLRILNMKKQIVALMLGFTMVITAAGCGASDSSSAENGSTESGSAGESSTETEAAESDSTSETTGTTDAESGVSSVQMNVDPADCVTSLCDYEGVPVSLSSYYEVSDENINEATEELLSGYNLDTKEVTDRTIVQEGDYVNIDYTGYQDGEAFSGGSATDVLVDVSNNMSVGGTTGFIDGFCDGLIGAEVGTTVSSEVTFPEDYGVDSLNGQTVVFEFVINGIYEPATMDEIEDSAIAELFGDSYGITSMETLKAFMTQYLESSNYSAVVSAVKEYVLENSTFELPDDYMDARLKEYEDTYAASYCEDGQTLEEYFQENFSIELSEAEEELRTYLEEQVSTEFAFSVIADQIGVEMDEDEYAAYVENFLTSSSADFSTEDDVYEYFGAGNVEDGMQYLRDLYRINKAIDYVADSAVVTYTTEE